MPTPEGAMLKLKGALRISVCVTFLSFAANVKCSSIASQGGTTTAHMPDIEMTEEDLFASEHWDSAHTRVLGFRLGMTREEASADARQHELSLIAPDLRSLAECLGAKCEVCTRHRICPGITLVFDNKGKIVEMEITLVPRDAAAVVRKAAITRKFKGNTYDFFNQYSDELRVRLLGPGVQGSKQRPSTSSPLRDFIYVYQQRGLKVYVELDERTPTAPASLAVSFLPPNAEEAGGTR